MSGVDDEDIVKNYTRARRFPQLIGVTHDGKRIPGGPYTYTQFVGGGLLLVVMWQTSSLWATGSLIRNTVVLVAVAGLVVWGLGKLPLNGRNPLSMVVGVSRALVIGLGSPPAIDGVVRRPRRGPTAVDGAVSIAGVPEADVDERDRRPAVMAHASSDVELAVLEPPTDVPPQRQVPQDRLRVVRPRSGAEPHPQLDQENPDPPIDRTAAASTRNADRLLAMVAAGRKVS